MTDHIKINNISPRITYTGNGSQTDFDFPFAVFAASQLHVFFNGAEQMTGFAVLNAGNSTGGTVIFDTAPAAGTNITLERILPIQRISDFIESGELSANALNNEFDYLTASAQQLQDNQNATIQFNRKEIIPNTILPGKTARANKALGFDSDGAIKLLETGTTYTTPSYTQSGTGAISRTLTDKIKELVSVKDFGATGDGVTNDTTALQNALAAHNHLYLPAGTYLLSATLEIGNNKIIQGAGASTILKAVTNSFDTLALIGSNSRLSDLTVQGGESGLRAYGKTQPCTGNTVENIIFKQQAIGIELDGYTNTGNPCDRNTFCNIMIEKPTQYGVLVTRSGAGSYPNANSFTSVRIRSLGTSISGAGFYIEGAKYNNALINCEASIAGTPAACIRMGSHSDKTLLCNIFCDGSNTVPNILLDNGSIETSIINLYSNSTGAAILDNSNGNYLAFNAGYPNKSRMNRSLITDLTVNQQRYTIENVNLPSAGNVTIDLAKTHCLVNATNGATTVQLPKADSTNNGAVVVVIKTDTSSNSVQVTEISGSGPDGRSCSMGSQHDRITVISDGSVWHILQTNIPSYNANYIDGVSSYSPDITRQLHLVSSFGGMCTVTLPPANNAASIGRFLTIKKTDASANAVRIIESGAVGPDNAIVNLTTRYAAITVMSNGGAWHVIAKV